MPIIKSYKKYSSGAIQLLLLFVGLAFLGVLVYSLRNGISFRDPRAQTPGTIVVDHTSVSLFEQIPDEYLEAARNLKMFWIDRSVGQNLNEGLDCLKAASYDAAPSSCRRGVTREEFQPDPVKYSRSNWQFYGWAGLGFPQEATCSDTSGTWSGKGYCFDEFARARVASYDVMSYQFSYLTVQDYSQYNVADPNEGFFVDRGNVYDVYDLQRFETDNSSKRVIYWTTSLARMIGSPQSESFNNQMRAFALANNKILFDFADIESHDPAGNPCYDNRDGVPYKDENYPDDGVNYLAICPNYTSEVNGGHLGSWSIGKIRVTKALWVLMAQIAGWNPGGSPIPTSTATATATPTPTPIPTSTPQPPQGGSEPVYHLTFDDEGAMGDCGGCTRYNTTLVEGRVGNAYRFNGADSYVDLGTLSHIKGKSLFSVSVWINPDFEETDSARRTVFYDGNSFGIFSLNTVSGFRTLFRFPSGVVRPDLAGLNWTPGTWHHLAVTYNGSEIRGYWDGVLVKTQAASGSLLTDTLKAKVGVTPILSDYFKGNIDELKIFDRTLTSSEVQSLFSTP